ncbi:MAG: hypothetical protein RJQ00_01000 [Vicingaceae bacterium]
MKQKGAQLFSLLLHSSFAVLFILAILLFKERLFADASYYFFHAINSGSFHVEHGRIVLGISQVLPLIGYYLGLPLKYLMVLGSLGHEVFYYAICLFLLYKLKDKAGAIAVLLIHVIGQLWLYYSPMLEICYGSALAVLFYALLKSGKYKDDKWFIFLLLVQWFAMSSHPENYVLILFALVFDYLNRGVQKKIHLSSILFLSVAILVEWLSFSAYELNHVNHTLSSGSTWLNVFQPDYAKDLLELFLRFFPEVLLFLLLSTIVSVYKKRYFISVLPIASAVFIILVINQKTIAIDFGRYLESMYNPLVFLAVVPFVYQIYQHFSKKWLGTISVILFIIVGIRIAWIWSYGKPLRQRVNQLEQIVDHAQYQSNTNFLINNENYSKPYSYINWAQPIESLLFSAMDGKDATVSVPSTEDYKYDNNAKELTDSLFIFRRFEIEPLSFLNPKFFSLRNKPYKALNTNGSTDFPEEIKANLSVNLIKNIQALNFKRGDTLFQAVQLINNSKFLIPSAYQSQVFIAYHWYKDGELYHWDGQRTLLEVDLNPNTEYIQDIQLVIPIETGIYELTPDIVIEGKRWLGLNKSYQIQVTI